MSRQQEESVMEATNICAYLRVFWACDLTTLVKDLSPRAEIGFVRFQRRLGRFSRLSSGFEGLVWYGERCSGCSLALCSLGE